MVIGLIIEDEGEDRLVKNRRGNIFRVRAATEEAKDIDTKLAVAAEQGEEFESDVIATADTEI